MAVKTRKPTGIPAWDLMLIAAGAKCGKSYTCAEASASKIIGRTFWLNWGEADPDEYGALVNPDGDPARFEVVEYDHTYSSLMNTIREVIAEPRGKDGKPNLIVLDKASKVWDLLSDQADYAARVRDARKKKLDHVPSPETVGDEVTIGNDLWNSATNRWLDMIDLLKTHDGPVILTANLKEVSVMDRAGRPTKEKQWKIEGQKNFAADVSCVVEIPVLREVYVTGVRSLRFEPVKTGEHTDKTRFKDFTIDKLWAALGLTSESTKRDHATIIRPGTDPDGVIADQIGAAVALALEAPLAERVDALRAVYMDFGKETMEATHVQAPDNSTVTAAQLINGWVGMVEQEIARAQQKQDAPAQSDARAQGAPAQQQDAHGILMDEIAGHAQVLGVQPGAYVKPLIDAHEGAQKVRDVAPAQVLAWVAERRAHVAVALREQGNATAAQNLETYPAAAWGTWAQVTSAREEQAEQAAEPANA